MTDPTTSWSGLARLLEIGFADELRSFTQDLWKEDAVTISLLRKARLFLSQLVVADPADRISIATQLFKADGPLEEMYGDAAVLVRIEYRDGYVLDGVAFYEAKVRDWSSQRLPAAKKPQLRRMYSRLKSGQLLIFDRARVVLEMTGILQTPWWWGADDYPTAMPTAPVTQAIAVPLGPVIKAPRLDSSVYRFGVPWSSQVVLRNLQGFDLDHDERIVEAAAGYADKKSAPRHLLSVSVRRGPGEPTLPPINEEVFREDDGQSKRF
jgi:hypothetical protein